MKPKTSKTSNLSAGKFYWISKHTTDFYWQVLLFKMTWLNFGLFFTSWCQKYSTHLMISTSGSIFLSRKLYRKIFRSVSKFWRNCILCWDLSSWEGWRKMWRLNCLKKLRRSSGVRWVDDKSIFMIKSFGTKIENKRQMSQQVWWMCWWASKKYAIILIFFSLELRRVLSAGFPWQWWSLITCFWSCIFRHTRPTS